MTIEGPIEPDALGITLPHEHLIVQGWEHTSPNYANSAYMELVKYARLGGRSIVDVSSIGQPRDPAFLREVARRAQVQVVLGTGYYKDAWLPEDARDMSIDAMTAAIVRDLTTGIGDTGIRAGVIGEVGVSRNPTYLEKRSLAAAARAQRETGAGLVLHLDIGAADPEYHDALDALAAEGADLGRVAVSHLVPRPNHLDLLRSLAGRGCFLAFDNLGAEKWLLVDDLVNTHPEVQVSSIRALIYHGLLRHILLSQNVAHVSQMTVNGGNGYEYVLRIAVPLLQAYGVSDEAIRTMTIDNPRRLLTPAA
jgi:phosphotriesterase-related protein